MPLFGRSPKHICNVSHHHHHQFSPICLSCHHHQTCLTKQKGVENAAMSLSGMPHTHARSWELTRLRRIMEKEVGMQPVEHTHLLEEGEGGGSWGCQMREKEGCTRAWHNTCLCLPTYTRENRIHNVTWAVTEYRLHWRRYKEQKAKKCVLPVCLPAHRRMLNRIQSVACSTGTHTHDSGADTQQKLKAHAE